jgi:hypothetical protein
MKNRVISVHAFLAVIVTGGISACSYQVDKAGANGAFAGKDLNSFAAIKTRVFDAKCARCHAGASAGGGVDVSSYQSIMGNPGLIEAGQPSKSRIYAEVSSGDMPLGGPALPAAEVAAIEQWILAGAPDGEFTNIVVVPTPAPQAPQPPTVGPIVATYTEVQSKILVQSCVRCHSGAQPPGGVDLTSYANLMSRPQNIIPGNSKDSLVYSEIATGSMPPRGAAVDPKLVQLLANWIDQGAKND